MGPKMLKVAVEPKVNLVSHLEDAVVSAGAELSDTKDAEVLIWADASAPEKLPEYLTDSHKLVSLPFTGINNFLPYTDDARTWTCARGVFARPVAEHALALTLAGMRQVGYFARSTTWTEPAGRNLVDGKVVIFGAGGIATQLISLLAGFNCDITVVRRRPDKVAGATNVVSLADRMEVLGDADAVVLALALTPETAGIIGKAELEIMAETAWLVNVARGAHVDTDALVEALDAGQIAGACLDVTEPEPLPDSHSLWRHPKAIITPHTADTPEMAGPLLAAHVRQNLELWGRGQKPDGVIDRQLGY